MLTNNYINYCRGRLFGSNGVMDMKTAGGTTFKYWGYSMYCPTNQGDFGCFIHKGRMESMGDTCQPGVYFGTDPTPATREDYKLGAPITSGITITSQASASVRYGEETTELQAVFTVQNTGTEAINIYEIGYFGEVAFGNSSSANYCYTALMDRTVLDEPITLAAGEFKTIVYKVTINHVLNIE